MQGGLNKHKYYMYIQLFYMQMYICTCSNV